MSEEQTIDRSEILTLTSEIVSAHVSNNATRGDAVPELIQSVFDKLTALASDEPAPTELTPAIRSGSRSPTTTLSASKTAES